MFDVEAVVFPHGDAVSRSERASGALSAKIGRNVWRTCTELQGELQSVSSQLDEVKSDRDSLAAIAHNYQSEKEICQTSTETYSKVVVASAKELGKLHQQIEQMRDDLDDKDAELVRTCCSCLSLASLKFIPVSFTCRYL
jgi:chromosome segregation ATPase